MRILGIDPGTNLCGYGLIEESNGKVSALKYGAVDSRKKKDHLRKLHSICTAISQIIEEEHPDILAIEKAFVSKNIQSAFKLGHVRGGIIFSALSKGVEVAEYSPTEIKQSVTGYGKAEKEQVNAMVQRLCNIKEKISPFDASDALATALCALSRASVLRRISEGL